MELVDIEDLRLGFSAGFNTLLSASSYVNVSEHAKGDFIRMRQVSVWSESIAQLS